jgi:hypothetical protein
MPTPFQYLISDARSTKRLIAQAAMDESELYATRVPSFSSKVSKVHQATWEYSTQICSMERPKQGATILYACLLAEKEALIIHSAAR